MALMCRAVLNRLVQGTRSILSGPYAKRRNVANVTIYSFYAPQWDLNESSPLGGKYAKAVDRVSDAKRRPGILSGGKTGFRNFDSLFQTLRAALESSLLEVSAAKRSELNVPPHANRLSNSAVRRLAPAALFTVNEQALIAFGVRIGGLAR